MFQTGQDRLLDVLERDGLVSDGAHEAAVGDLVEAWGGVEKFRWGERIAGWRWRWRLDPRPEIRMEPDIR